MSAVLMENPLHGRHHFYSPAEVEQAKLAGWVEVVEPQAAPKAEPKPVPEPAPKPKAKPKPVAKKKARR